jgi:Ca2+/Na+ antiporter
MLEFYFNLLPQKFMKSILRGISFDKSLPNAWTRLYKNLYFRFIMIFVVSFQTSKNRYDALITTLATLVFFYLISSKKERKETLNNNHNIDDFKTFVYFCFFLVGVYYLKKNIIPQDKSFSFLNLF